MTRHVIQVLVDWDNDGSFTGPGEDITAYVRNVRIRRGSGDLLRSRTASIGKLDLVVNNSDKRFSPLYASGPLYGNLVPGRVIKVLASYGGAAYTPWYGYVTMITPKSGTILGTTATLVCEDLLSVLQTYKLNMPLLTNVTGDTAVRQIINFAFGAPPGQAIVRLLANPSDGDTVTVNGSVYTFKTALGATANQVLIGATLEDTAVNLAAAINGASGSGTLYTANTTQPAYITASASVELPTRASLWHFNSLILTGAALTITTNAATYYRATAAQTPATNSDSFTNGFYVTAGTYTLSVMGIAGNSKGIVDWYVDNALVQAGQDWYNAATTQQVSTTAAFTLTTSGWHVLKGKVNSKNASSSGYTLSFSKLFVKQAVD